MKLSILSAAPVLVLCTGAVLRAQAPAYARAPGDTLRYHEVTTGTVEARTAAGAVTLTTRHDARVAVVFGAADTARAWFEALSLGMTGPQGERTADAGALIGQPYTLVIGPRGDVKTVAMPAFPEAVQQVSELGAEFIDFFPRLPGRPLAAGAAWTDTTRHETTSTSGRSVVARRVGEFLVRGDSAIGGMRVAIVEARTRTELLSSGPYAAAPGMTMRSGLEGEENGVFYFAPETGRLVGRRRSGRLTGALTITGPAGQATIPQTYTYESSLELIR